MTTLEALKATITKEFVKSIVPKKDKEYTPWGNYEIIKRVISSKNSKNLYLTGLSGCGKTKSIQQACAELKKPLILLQITSETSERELIGGYNLSGGEYVWNNGAVVEAILSNAVLVLDEVDKGTSSLMCLQSILNKDDVLYIKELNLCVPIPDDFTVMATANTKGAGDVSGLFITSNVLDGAFLDRFDIMLEQKYPSKDEEIKILHNIFGESEETQNDIELLTEIASRSRKLFLEGETTDVLSTRGLINTLRNKQDIYYDFDNPLFESLMGTICRFDETTVEAIKAFWDTLQGDEEEETEDVIEEGFFSIDHVPEFDNLLP